MNQTEKNRIIVEYFKNYFRNLIIKQEPTYYITNKYIYGYILQQFDNILINTIINITKKYNFEMYYYEIQHNLKLIKIIYKTEIEYLFNIYIKKTKCLKKVRYNPYSEDNIYINFE